MGCGIYWQQVHEVERALDVMRKYGVPETSEAYQTLWGERGELLSKVGVKSGRVADWIMDWATWSPQMARLMHDPEIGWVVAIKDGPGQPLRYKIVSDEEAMAILKNQVTPELKQRLLTPDEYLGE